MDKELCEKLNRYLKESEMTLISFSAKHGFNYQRLSIFRNHACGLSKNGIKQLKGVLDEAENN